MNSESSAGLVLEDMRGTHVQHCQQMSIGTLGIPNVPGTVAAIPINPMGCDGITWDVPQSPMINEFVKCT